MVFKVMSNGECMGVADTREKANDIVRMRKLGRNGMPNPNSSNITKAWAQTYDVVEAPSSGGSTILSLGKYKPGVVYGPFK